jgi:hypothetical protein
MTITIFVERDEKEIQVLCVCKYWSATRGFRDKYGAPETPDDPAEIEIQSSYNEVTGELVELTDEEMEEVVNKGFEQIADMERDCPEPEWPAFNETPVDNN